ncbi:J domain-containing protein [Mycena chlorophos]|uniref:J domain-containing protein n=1 Tax=Mycena chlorophos TaxID=658473 RepID=A0A8H6SM30_MYCCL|nr:J domain-containing protein [Mycena chlorophos]
MNAYRRGFASSSRRRAPTTHYDILGVARTASKSEIKRAFFALSKTHHPDVHDAKSRPEFHQITEAYNVLRDPVSRRAYDNTLPSTPRPGPSTLQSRHMADTAARYRRAAASGRSHHAAPPGSRNPSSSPKHPSQTQTAGQPPFRARPTPSDALPGARDRHNSHPGQRYVPPDPLTQAQKWAAKKAQMRDEKTRAPKYVGTMVLGIGILFAGTWVAGSMEGRW